MLLIGVDVGGTNSDAVVVVQGEDKGKGFSVASWSKVITTQDDITRGGHDKGSGQREYYRRLTQKMKHQPKHLTPLHRTGQAKKHLGVSRRRDTHGVPPP